MKRFFLFQTINLFLLCLMLPSCMNQEPLLRNEETAHKKLKQKYAEQLGVEPSLITNVSLYLLLDDWIGVPYKYGGKDKHGIDCSGFTAAVMQKLFNKDVSGPSWSMAEKCKKLGKEELKEGDLVFFTISGNKISHVGIYLMNGRFVHASTSRGVMISDMSEAYYSKYFTQGGRVP